MAKQVFESHDLIRLIYSFGTPEHRTFTQSLTDVLPSQSSQLAEYFESNRDIYPDIYHFLDGHSIRDLQQYLNKYKRCFCCTRHNRNKPILTNGVVVIPGPSVFENSTTLCPCPCRSLSRNMIKNIEERTIIL